MLDARAQLRRLDRWMVRNVPPPLPWWFWPALMLAIGVMVVVVSLVFNPGPNETVELWGGPWGSVCAFKVQTGLPCPQCGMTRSWVHAARLHLLTSFLYNPAGATMFWWAVICGGLGAIRLAFRDPKKFSVPDRILAGSVVVWLVALYAAGWILRVTIGLNPLP